MTQQEEKIYLGYSFTDSFVQIGYYTDQLEEPKLLTCDEAGVSDPIPLAVCRLKYSDRWLYGQEALAAGKDGQGTVVVDLLPLLMVNEPVVIDNISYGPMELMNIFLRKSFSRLHQICKLDQVAAVTFAFPRLNYQAVMDLRRIWQDLPLRGRPLYLLDHKESFYQFVVHQNKELYHNDVILLEQVEDSLRAWNLVQGRLMKEQPFLIREDRFPAFRFADRDEDTDRQLFLLMERLMGKRLISTILLSGEAFNDRSWMKQSKDIITRGRRVFCVDDLFARGACYRSQDGAGEKKKKEKPPFFMGEHQLHMHIGVYVWNGREQEYCRLVNAGTDWYEADGAWPFLLDNCDSVCFQVDHVSEEKEERRIIPLDWLPKRPNLATKLEISLEFLSADNWMIHLKDLGLGELFPGTFQTVTEKMN